MMIIGISGKSGEGKDKVAEIIQSSMPNFDWYIKRWADQVKRVAAVILHRPVEDFHDREFKESSLGPEWDNMSVRVFLQKLGTDAIRFGLHQATWINSLLVQYREGIDNWLIPDTRFKNEYVAIQKAGGINVRVKRYATFDEWNAMTGLHDFDEYSWSSEQIDKITYIKHVTEWNFKEKDAVVAKLMHSSETALDDAKFDVVLKNYGTVERLEKEVKSVLLPSLFDRVEHRYGKVVL